MSSSNPGPPLPGPPPETPPIRWAARLAGLVWWLLFAGLLVLALYAGIGRQLTQNIDRFRQDLADELSARMGRQVDIDALDARWNWLDPTLLAHDIRVMTADGDAVAAHLQHLRVRLDFLSSLLRFRLVFAEFEADGLDLTLRQSPNGDLRLPGPVLSAPARGELQTWLDLAGKWLSEPFVRITRVSLQLQDGEDSPRYLDIPQLDLVYRRGLFRASGRAMRAGTTEQLASFALVGQHFFRGDFTGQLYLDVDSGRLFDGLIDDYRWRELRIEGVDLGGEAWLTFRSGHLEQVNGTLRTPYLQLGVANTSLAPLEDIQARFGWRRRGGDEAETLAQTLARGELHVQSLQWTWDGDTVPAFSLRVRPRGDGFDLVADTLPLAPVRRLLVAVAPLPERLARALTNYRPSGFLDHLHLVLPGAADAGRFALLGQLRDVSIQAHDGAPGASGLAGTLYMDARSGFVRLTPGAVTLGFPELFRADWAFAEMRGTVAWQLEGAITRVYADDLQMRYGEATELTGAFDLRMDREGEDNLGLRIGVRDGNAGLLADFVPQKAVNPELYHWLTTAIPSARIEEGVFYGHGQIDGSAPHGAFVSSMWYRFSEATVRYDERWPELTQASGRVDIHNGRTEIQLASGQVGGIDLSPSRVRVLPGTPTRVQVTAKARVPGEAIPFWLANSPLGAMAGASARNLRYEGQYTLDLDLDLPLAEAGTPSVRATVAVDGATVTYPEAGLSWTSVTGQLTYDTRQGFSGGPLQARFFEQPVAIDFAVGPEDHGLVLRQNGRLAFPDTFRRLGLEGGTTFGVGGRLDYVAELTVSTDSTSRIRVQSPLRGLVLDWPEPLGKAAPEDAPLEAFVDPSAEGGVAVSGRWTDRADFELLWKDSGFELTMKDLHIGEHILRDIQLDALRLSDRWVVRTRSERAVGQLVLPSDGSPVKADFEQVHLVRGAAETPADPASSPELLSLEEQLDAFKALDMGSWPDVDVTIADLRLDQGELGRWSFQLRPEPYRLKVNGIEGRLNSLTLLGDMTWSIISDRETTRFAGSVSGGTLKDLNQLFGVEMPLTNKKTQVELDVDWPGRPDEFSMRRLSGSISVRLDDGIILEQNNTAQLFRIFNLLNADTIWRRLKLDFSDLYERGVAFDAISGKARIVDGLVTLDPELQVVGPSGAFKLSGTTDLSEERLDMRLVVVLPLTQNLPLAALLMGAGAPIGGALFVLDKVLGDPLSKLTSATYSVTGTWDNPEVELRRVFDTGG